ncbi:MAG: type II secretion system protein [Aureliella sp.]
MQLTNSKSRGAYTLLELMIALGLLGALMSVAWSLMATFRDADERGWKITRRIQIIRAAHDWLQSDAQAMLGSSSESIFTGNSLRFSATIAPSLDPLPFLQRLLNDSEAPDAVESRAGTASTAVGLASTQATVSQLSPTYSPMDGELSDSQTDVSPWSPQQVQIEYELLPVDKARSSNAVDATRLAESLKLDEVQFMLVRREFATGTNSSSEQLSTQDNSTEFVQEVSPSDRVLTGQDLYRQSDDQQQSRGLLVTQSRLEGLIQPQFQYCDGRIWKDSWNSRSDGGLPHAIALRFDFPARAQMQPPQPRRTSVELEVEPEFVLQDSGGLSAADLASTGEAQAEMDYGAEASLMESDQFEVQMIVSVSGRTLHASRPLNDTNPLPPLDAAGSSEFSTPQSSTDIRSNVPRGDF